MNTYWTQEFLKNQIKQIIDFYYPACIDRKNGGYINQFKDDGSIYDASTKHLVGTCRFIINFSVAAELFPDQGRGTGKATSAEPTAAAEKSHAAAKDYATSEIKAGALSGKYTSAALHGLAFLLSSHADKNHGGFHWILRDRDIQDDTKHCYGHAFVFLALAIAARLGLRDLTIESKTVYEHLGDVWELLEKKFWDADNRLYVDEISGDWKRVSPYRGQNANMHMCEAMLAAFDATGEERYIERACTLAYRINEVLSASTDGIIWEHYDTGWNPDFEYNKNDPKNLFRPYGFLAGHLTEWAKLLLILERERPEPWILPKAEFLFNTALSICWDSKKGGIFYTFDLSRNILDTDKYYWVMAESLAAAALLYKRTKKEEYSNWYERIWEWSAAHIIDNERGGWYRVLDENTKRYNDLKSPPSKTDYHPVMACFEILRTAAI